MNARTRIRRPDGDPPSRSAAPTSSLQRSASPGAAGLMRLQATSGNRAVQRQVREATLQRAGEDDGYGVYKQVQLPGQAAPEAAAAAAAPVAAAPAAAAPAPSIAPGYVPHIPPAPSPQQAPAP
ncbi:MAG: hypothetical protein Q7K37_13130, partial [Dehalococcoidia bacterium]|nr:hypothetical protein [Dehalococcoidia bacterium]